MGRLTLSHCALPHACAEAHYTVVERRALSTRNADPERASRPWDKNRDGFVMGEGSGVLCMESLEHAQQRGAHIICEYMGGATNSDAYSITDPRPDGSGVAACIEMAMKDANVTKEQVSAPSYMNRSDLQCFTSFTSDLAIRSLSELHIEPLWKSGIVALQKLHASTQAVKSRMAAAAAPASDAEICPVFRPGELHQRARNQHSGWGRRGAPRSAQSVHGHDPLEDKQHEIVDWALHGRLRGIGGRCSDQSHRDWVAAPNY